MPSLGKRWKLSEALCPAIWETALIQFRNNKGMNWDKVQCLLVLSTLLQASWLVYGASDKNIIMDGCKTSALITRSQHNNMMLAEPKSGTTVFDWIVRRLFIKTAERIKKCNRESDEKHSIHHASVEITNENSFLRYKDHTVSFSRLYKHDSIWLNTLSRKEIYALADYCEEHSIPAWSKACLEHLPDLGPIRAASRNVTIIVTVRDPISVSLSAAYFSSDKELTRSELNDKITVGIRGCTGTARTVAIRFELASILKSYGYDVHIFFYEDLRRNPAKYIFSVARNLGVQVDEEIVHEIIEETSIEASKKAQELLNSNKSISSKFKKEWRGIGDNHNNIRKVRSGEIRGYEDQLKTSVLKLCVNSSRFHLPPELRSMYFPSSWHPAGDDNS